MCYLEVAQWKYFMEGLHCPYDVRQLTNVKKQRSHLVVANYVDSLEQ